MEVFALSREPYRPQHAPRGPFIFLSHAHPSAAVGKPPHVLQPWIELTTKVLGTSVYETAFVIHIAALMRELPAEIASPSLGPISKPLSRILAKLNAEDYTLVASEQGCQVALCLLAVSTCAFKHCNF